MFPINSYVSLPIATPVLRDRPAALEVHNKPSTVNELLKMESEYRPDHSSWNTIGVGQTFSFNTVTSHERNAYLAMSSEELIANIDLKNTSLNELSMTLNILGERGVISQNIPLLQLGIDDNLRGGEEFNALLYFEKRSENSTSAYQGNQFASGLNTLNALQEMKELNYQSFSINTYV